QEGDTFFHLVARYVFCERQCSGRVGSYEFSTLMNNTIMVLFIFWFSSRDLISNFSRFFVILTSNRCVQEVVQFLKGMRTVRTIICRGLIFFADNLIHNNALFLFFFFW